ncbi:unnamed protein product [Schistosoma margrebowiei]|uniref:Uncharacterized protein n=1 Tax=Schistosoma margrebowiei TaxID=48269 RepID=A0A183LN54_9TREM|nr:unnamed protein product [Schistosoma margrebowiei]
MDLYTNWTEFTSPWDLLIDCILLNEQYTNASNTLCIVSTIFGILMGYIFPFIGLFNIISNCIIIIIFFNLMIHYNKQFLLLAILSITDIGIILFVGWLRLFPTFGLPYITSGTIYYFILTRSSISCKLFTFFQGFFCTLRGNLFILLAIDRFLLIYKPLIYNKFSNQLNWLFIFMIMIIITIIIILPLTILVDLIEIRQLNVCWFLDNTNYLLIHQALLSNTCPLQLTLVTLVDLLFLIKVIKWTRNLQRVSHSTTTTTTSSSSTTTTSATNKINISLIVTMIILQIVAFLFSLPNSIVYLISLTIDFQLISSDIVRLLVITSNMSWNLIFFQSSFNIFIYYYRIRKFKQLLKQWILYCQCYRHKSIQQTTSITNR